MAHGREVARGRRLITVSYRWTTKFHSGGNRTPASVWHPEEVLPHARAGLADESTGNSLKTMVSHALRGTAVVSLKIRISHSLDP